MIKQIVLLSACWVSVTRSAAISHMSIHVPQQVRYGYGIDHNSLSWPFDLPHYPIARRLVRYSSWSPPELSPVRQLPSHQKQDEMLIGKESSHQARSWVEVQMGLRHQPPISYASFNLRSTRK